MTPSERAREIAHDIVAVSTPEDWPRPQIVALEKMIFAAMNGARKAALEDAAKEADVRRGGSHEVTATLIAAAIRKLMEPT